EVSFKDLLFSSKNDIIEAMEHIYYQTYGDHHQGVEWDQLANQLNVVNDISTAEGEIEDFRSYHVDLEHMYFDVRFFISVFKNGISIHFSYKNGIIDKSEISHISKKFVAILKEAIESPNIKLKHLSHSEVNSLKGIEKRKIKKNDNKN
ncbi:hypothetical protein, partial [uncultured Aquimarina sp.]|uniref:hypothetical protein n=1 Tax=uncultured Aquimarina sp. TaxID=575652 RepID=UPI002639E74D